MERTLSRLVAPFVNNDDFNLNSTEGVDGGSVMTGSAAVYGWNDRKPFHAINFVTVHDGFTLYDPFSYDEKQNGCGLLNPICCDDPLLGVTKPVVRNTIAHETGVLTTNILSDR